MFQVMNTKQHVSHDKLFFRNVKMDSNPSNSYTGYDFAGEWWHETNKWFMELVEDKGKNEAINEFCNTYGDNVYMAMKMIYEIDESNL